MNERQQTCPWCHPDKNGNYATAVFKNPLGSSLTIYYCGAQETLAMRSVGVPESRLAHPIYHCPMCGRHVRRYPEETEEKA